MTEESRKLLNEVQVPVRVRPGDESFYIKATDLIDDIEIAMIKSPTFKKELKNLIQEIIQ